MKEKEAKYLLSNTSAAWFHAGGTSVGPGPVISWYHGNKYEQQQHNNSDNNSNKGDNQAADQMRGMMESW